MTCPYCDAELKYVDYYYTGKPESFYGTAGCGIHYPSTMKKLGDIYQCPNHEGFEDLDLAAEYVEKHCLGDILLEEVACDSGCNNGFFYTTENNDLREGYPC